MYTEFVFAIELKEETPKNVIKILEYMIEEEEHPIDLPKHEFFETDRWDRLFISHSCYFEGITSSKFRFDDVSETYFLTTRSNLKNYNQEIEKFLNWIKPYIKGYGHKFLGYKRYEEDEEPTLIYLDSLDGISREVINNKKVKYKKKNIFKRMFSYFTLNFKVEDIQKDGILAVGAIFLLSLLFKYILICEIPSKLPRTKGATEIELIRFQIGSYYYDRSLILMNNVLAVIIVVTGCILLFKILKRYIYR